MADQAPAPQNPGATPATSATPGATATPSPNPSPTPAAPATPSTTPRTTDRVEQATVRRAPKYAVFLGLGAALGIIAALVLTFGFDRSASASDTALVYSPMQVFGFLSLVCISIGLAVGGLVAILLDRTVGRRQRTVLVDRETVHTAD